MRYGSKYRTWGDYNRQRSEKRKGAAAVQSAIESKYIVDKYGRIIGPRKTGTEPSTEEEGR